MLLILSTKTWMVSNCHYNIQSRVEPSWMVKCEWLSSPSSHSKQGALVRVLPLRSEKLQNLFWPLEFQLVWPEMTKSCGPKSSSLNSSRRFFEPSWLSSLAEKSPRVPRPGIINQRLFESDRNCSVREAQLRQQRGRNGTRIFRPNEKLDWTDLIIF